MEGSYMTAQRGGVSGHSGFKELKSVTRTMIIHIPQFVITGKVSFLAGSRFTDFLNSDIHEFILLKDSSIYSIATGKLEKDVKELQVNKEIIQMCYQNEDISEKDKK
jgi:hypothetical protein